jgi:superfamily I DNA and/or RNA helicase
MNYASHNRLYVAITRAKYALHLLGEKSRGVSDLLEEAIKKDLIDVS